jgi:hypothetical protein
MAVIDITEDANGRDGAESDTREVTYTRTFTVKTSSDKDGAEVIRNSDYASTFTDTNGVERRVTIPRINEVYLPQSGIADLSAFCNGVRCVPTPNKQVWRVIATYSNRLERPDLNLIDPLFRTPDVEWDVQPTTYAITRDADENPIRNSATDPFDPPLTDEETVMVLRVTRFRDKFDPIFYNRFHNKINSLAWNGLKKRYVRCRRIKGNKVFENAKYIYRITYEFEMRETRIPANNLYNGERILSEPDNESYAWLEWILNRGYREIRNGQVQAALDYHVPIPATSPVMLDANGARLPLEGTPVYLGFRTKRDIDFNLLDLDLSGQLNIGEGV